MTRYNLVSPRPRKDGKTYWAPIGTAFSRDKGGFSLVFDALPLPDAEGRVTVLMTEPQDRDGGSRQQRSSNQQSGGAGGYSDGFSDEIPFAPSVL